MDELDVVDEVGYDGHDGKAYPSLHPLSMADISRPTPVPAEEAREETREDIREDHRSYSRERSRSRSRSPRRDRGERKERRRSASPNGRDISPQRSPRPDPRLQAEEEDDNSRNPGTNLFVTGINRRLNESDVSATFGEYGTVVECTIMRDPHTRDSRGFGFVKMATVDEADAAKVGLQGKPYEGVTLSIEMARRNRPRKPTPGQYYGPPKRDSMRGPPPGRFGDRYGDRYEDRRGYRGRDEPGARGRGYGDRYGDRYGEQHGDRRGGRYADRYDDRSYGRRDAHSSRDHDRYESSRDYGYDTRRGGGGYDRNYRSGPGQDSKDSYGGGSGRGRPYNDRPSDSRPQERYAGR
ncbi:MAG: hypothetical protein M1820_004967 [Bogoriella megaspora]|nr:MAG: hypothetical protein M1820_004967 [Bogoriella megaspora]